MSMEQLMALVPIEAATTLSTTTAKGRKSRWERSTTAARGKSRFGPKDDKPYHPPPFIDLPPGLTPTQVDQFLREQRLDELTSKLERGELEFGDPDIRAPSPPPAYDKNGNRTNTRDVRVRNAMVAEHQRLLEYMTATVAGFLPPTDFKPVKKIRRIIIPQEKYPEYNFMGLIIGPRGCNHKRLESESGAQISIRGRGTQKEGKKTDHQTEEEAAMPQHIHIAADTEESLDKAVGLIEPLLNPQHPAHDEFKKKGLEQLALVNGVTLTKLDTRCTACGATGHLSWECPDQEFQSFQKPDVKCALCGDKGHVTMDCKLAQGLTSEQLAEVEKKSQGVTTGGPHHFGGAGGARPGGGGVLRSDRAKLDKEFTQMMTEITGRPPTATTSTGYTNSATVYNTYARNIPPPPPTGGGTTMGASQPHEYVSYYGTNLPYSYAGNTAGAAAPVPQPQQMDTSHLNQNASNAMWGNLANYCNSMGMAGLTQQQQMEQMSQMMMAMYPQMLMMNYGYNPAAATVPGATPMMPAAANSGPGEVLPPPPEDGNPSGDDVQPPAPMDEDIPPWQQ